MKKFNLVLLMVLLSALFSSATIYADSEITVSEANNTESEKESSVPETDPMQETAIPRLISVKALDYHSIQISWKAVPGAKSYTLYYKPAKQKNWIQLQNNLTDTTYIHKNSRKFPLIAGQKYFYTVQAVSETKTTPYDPAGKSAKAVPEAVTSGKVKSAAYNQLQITWKKVPGASGYVVYRRSGSEWKKVAITKDTSYLHTASKKFPIKTGSTYRYTIRAFRLVNNRKILGKQNLTGFQGKTIPDKVTITGSEYDLNRKIILRWQRVPGASGYIVYRKAANGDWKKVKTLTGADQTEFAAASTKKFPVKYGKTYIYGVRAFAANDTLGKISKKSICAKNPALALIESANQNAERIVNQITDPSMTQSQKLRKCFDWVMAKPYITRRQFSRTPGWTALFANDHFILGGGTCHADACAFAYLAKALDYKEVYVCTDTAGTSGAHSWTEINGLAYDPLFAQAKSFSKNYAVPYGIYILNPVTREKIS